MHWQQQGTLQSSVTQPPVCSPERSHPQPSGGGSRRISSSRSGTAVGVQSQPGLQETLFSQNKKRSEHVLMMSWAHLPRLESWTISALFHLNWPLEPWSSDTAWPGAQPSAARSSHLPPLSCECIQSPETQAKGTSGLAGSVGSFLSKLWLVQNTDNDLKMHHSKRTNLASLKFSSCWKRIFQAKEANPGLPALSYSPTLLGSHKGQASFKAPM